MKSVSVEAARLEALLEYQILDTAPEETFDDLVQLAAQICQTPIALINLIADNRQWFKAKVGLDFTEVSREIGLCPLVLTQTEPLVINDTLADERFRKNSVVTSEPYIRFYAGVPLITATGYVLGTLCVCDRKPRHLQQQQVEALQKLSRQIISQLELRRNLAALAKMTTACKRAEAALTENEQRYRSVVSAMQEGIVLHQANGSIYECNSGAERILGLTAAQIIGRCGFHPQWRTIHADGSPFLPERYPAIVTLRTGKPCSNVVMGVAKPDGNFAWISINTQPLFTPGETKPSTVVCSFSDISNAYSELRLRQQAETALRWQDALLRSMADASPLAFYIVDHRTDAIIYFNHRFCEIWGIEHLEAALSRASSNDIISHCTAVVKDASAFMTSYAALCSEENRCIVEDEIALIDGRIIRFYSTQVRDQQDRYFGRLYLFEDITKRKRTEQKIREQAALLDVATDAIRVQDLETTIKFWNKGAERLYGWQAAEAIGKKAKELLYAENCAEIIATAQKITIDKGNWQGELQQVTKMGAKIVLESRWTVVYDEQGQPNSILVVNTDITEKKQLEAQFLRAQRMESLGTLASGIAHDLNNILAPILMSAQLLQMHNHDQRSQRLLNTIENNAKRGGALVKQVLEFARGAEGDRTLTHIQHLMTEIKQIVLETFPKSIGFFTYVEPDLGLVCGDATQLHQILMNLCVNARDAMPNGGKLSITAHNKFLSSNYARMHLDAKVGQYVMISVADNGCGIPPQIVERIFEPFFTTKELGKGTGLGLSTVIGIVKSHGGFVNVDSHVGSGTEFQVYLPAVSQTHIAPLTDIKLPHGNQEVLLLVDDEQAICETTKSLLETFGYKVLSASHGREAIALYTQYKNEIRVVLIDMMMPIMDGATTIQMLQQINGAVKIIAISGLNSTYQQPAIDQSPNVKAFLSKPFTIQQLLPTLNAVLNTTLN